MSDFNEEYALKITRREVSLVVCPIDTFTGMMAYAEGLRVWVEGLSARPVVKPTGEFVFFDLPVGTWQVHVESKLFFEEIRDVEVEEEASREKGSTLKIPNMLTIRLIPTRRYGVPPDTKLVTGYYPPGTGVYVTQKDNNTGIKSMSYEEIEGNAQMVIYSAYALNPMGKEFGVLDQEGEMKCFVVVKKIEKGVNLYRISTLLTKPLIRGQALYLVSRGRADSTGYLFLPVKNIAKNAEVRVWD